MHSAEPNRLDEPVHLDEPNLSDEPVHLVHSADSLPRRCGVAGTESELEGFVAVGRVPHSVDSG